MISDFILNEYKARQSWEGRDYPAALKCAGRAAEAARESGDESGWWRMTFLMGECQLELGQMEDCSETALQLVSHPLSLEDPELAAKAKALRSLGLQGQGLLPQALQVARAAALELPDGDVGGRGKLEAQQALVAVLAESGNFDDAWTEAEVLASMVGDDTGLEKAGKAYWSVGNAAFLAGRHSEATHYHGLASASLSPTNDVSLWALFNKASAFMRLTANLVEPETLQCIERAEMAISITGGTPQDEIELAITRAYWSFLTGDLAAARSKMNAVMGKSEIMAPHIEGEALFLLARILRAEGHLAAAADRFALSAHLFETAGAGARAEQSRRFLTQLRESADD
ncbi:hypothetical protein GCM10009636_21360 [Arthrobacter koreensis]|jgi:tetratricopeptide (TPR) repeat protein|uniref:Tetratricopeptide repeat-containing protein n=2 Tax=Arthrobacter TaxID=1663 RepID=A0ABY6FWG0_9MICC|nr:hypothetical protein [Arthrobacter koreensis]UYB37076.1 hypothetical protein N9A08_05305 [Arthrobacter koreensis]